jgi:ectoine hydroxylase-related dioxygenase (phytanoyl-CoA dioxygenase family)
VVPGSNNEPVLRSHKPKGASRDEYHTLVIETKPTDQLVYLPVARGSVTIHDERIVHGSAGNLSDNWRKTYVMAFRDQETVRREREMGFTHSHNDQVNWDEIIH